MEEYATLLDGSFRDSYNAHGKALHDLIEFQDNQAHTWADKAKSAMLTAQNLLVLISALGLVLGLGIAFWVARSLQVSLRGIAESVAESKDTVSNASDQLNTASQQLANSSTEAAASLEETVASIEELTSMVKLNAGNAQQASQLARVSQDSAVKGDKEIETLITAMSEINQSSKKIEDIINVIDDIAFQTNLLALNAAVEAARAGEQGKGFAVVAEAVRTLAQRSAQAAKEISVLIRDSVSQVEKGTQVADRSGGSLKEIVNSVKKVTDLNSEIATASSEQSEGIAQISKAMNQLDQATQSNAASAEEAAASAEVMLKQARVLGDQVASLMRIVG
jgi:methyl-accepting chemotaxis protein